ncbi:MAG: SDR family NAD(P)-dependent oxidoreductase [Reyranellaceae bacterium]
MRPTSVSGRLADKVAIVSGAGFSGDLDHLGTGAAIALLFAAAGAKVCVLDMDAGRGQATVGQIEREGGQALYVQANVTDSEDCRRTVALAESRFGRLDILVNNIGGNKGGGGVGRGKLDSITDEAWRSLVEINLTSAFLLSKAALPALTRRPGSAIVNISSIAALQALGGAAYSAAKAGLVAMTSNLAVSFGRAGLRANAIAPGLIYTPMVSGIINPAVREMRRNIAPLNTVEGSAWDIASAALFLASDEARFVSGVCLAVDGAATCIAPLAALEMIGHKFEISEYK